MDRLHPLRAYRHAHGLTLEGMANMVGTTATTISRMENGKQNLTHGLLIRISEATGISIDDLVRANADAA